VKALDENITTQWQIWDAQTGRVRHAVHPTSFVSTPAISLLYSAAKHGQHFFVDFNFQSVFGGRRIVDVYFREYHRFGVDRLRTIQ
jgi:hypothetical protein